MPWKVQTPMSQRKAFIEEAQQEGSNISVLSRKYDISRKTAYKWLKRVKQAGLVELADRSRRPKNSPNRTKAEMEEEVLNVRRQHAVWGGRKIRRVLQNLGCTEVPAISTITAILHRHGMIDQEEAQKHKPWQRFEYSQPNQLWQMDFKGYFSLREGGYCHPLTVIDDHSRFLVGLKACPNETIETVKGQLIAIFECFGLPERMLMDNGSAWGFDRDARHTTLTAWLIRLGIAISHGRPYHPQTQGKNERFNRTLLTEVIKQYEMSTLEECQKIFDAWWQVYNYDRPHDALQLQTPSTHFIPSTRPYPTILPPVIYEPDDMIRKVDLCGNIYFHGRRFHISSAFRHQPIALRPADLDGTFHVFFCNQKVAQIILRKDNVC